LIETSLEIFYHAPELNLSEAEYRECHLS